MIHIATLHANDDHWIDVQLRHLDRHTTEPHRVWASSEGLDGQQRARFHRAIDHPLGGVPVASEEGMPLVATVWNRLAAEIVRDADPDDMLVFMHGDAFPIADWVCPVRRMLSASPLAAVRRDENFEPIPHECFCATTVRFWSEVGDWSPGPTWECDGDRVTDPGATLWRTLESRGIEWRPILRTNATNPHPLWFGVYGGIVYHHGAGFRAPMSRRDESDYSDLPVPVRNVARARRRIANELLARRMRRRIARDECFHHALTGSEPR